MLPTRVDDVEPLVLPPLTLKICPDEIGGTTEDDANDGTLTVTGHCNTRSGAGCAVTADDSEKRGKHILKYLPSYMLDY